MRTAWGGEQAALAFAESKGAGAWDVMSLFARAHRGGTYKSDRALVRASARGQRDQTSREPWLGFRCCKDAE